MFAHCPKRVWLFGNHSPFSRVAPTTFLPPSLLRPTDPTPPWPIPSEWYTWVLLLLFEVTRNESTRSLRHSGRFRFDRLLGRHRPRTRAHRQRQGLQIACRLQRSFAKNSAGLRRRA